MKKLVMMVLVLLVLPAMAEAQMVAYNTSSGKYHHVACKWAKKCTKNCIMIDKQEAIKRGGVPCKVCGG